MKRDFIVLATMMLLIACGAHSGEISTTAQALFRPLLVVSHGTSLVHAGTVQTLKNNPEGAQKFIADATFPFQDESHSRYLVGLTNGLVENRGLGHLVYSIGTPGNPTLHTGQVLVQGKCVVCIASLMRSTSSLAYRYVPVVIVNSIVVEEKTVTISSVSGGSWSDTCGGEKPKR